MSSNERQFEGVWIPKEIYLRDDLTPTEKLLLAEIKCFTKNGTCFASNEHFSKFLGISKSHVSKLISKLNKMGLIAVNMSYKGNSMEIDKRIITPLLNNEYIYSPTDNVYTYTHESVDPLRVEDDTPIPQSVDPLRVEAKDKVNNKIQSKVKYKELKKINKKSESSELESEFESLWERYPRKVGKVKALSSYIKSRKVKKYTFEQIEIGLNKYIEYLKINGTDEQFIQHGSTWFNQENFLSEYETTKFPKKPQLSRFNQSMLMHMEDPDDFLNSIGVEGYEPRGNRKIVDAGEV